MNIKVQIQTRCEHCDGEAYILVGEAIDANGNLYPRYLPCGYCKGSGEQARWVSMWKFHTLIEEVKCPHERTSFHGGLHFNGGDVWDNIAEVCDDCGTNLDKS